MRNKTSIIYSMKIEALLNEVRQRAAKKFKGGVQRTVWHG
jgi:hypothetical protein